MKTSERHHLKENDLALALARAQAWLEANRGTAGLVVGALVLALAAGAGFAWWQTYTENQARAMLATAMVTYESRVMPPAAPASPDQPTMSAQIPGTFASDRARLEAALPQLLAAADAYPGTDAGRTARFHAAAVLVALGRYDEGIAQYDRVAAGQDLLARTARLGKAEAQVQAAQYDQAIAAYKAIAETPDATLPMEGVLMELARVYELAGRVDEARTTLTTIVEQHADSPLATAARDALDRLQG